MNRRTALLLGATAALALVYIGFFTDWVSPEPIQIASQVRPVIQQPRFGRKTAKVAPGNPQAPDPKGNVLVSRDGNPSPIPLQQPLPSGGPPSSTLEEPVNGTAHVTFSLDDRYALTSIQVLELTPEGGRGRIVWDLEGKSRPLNGLIYGRTPPGMNPKTPDTLARTLEPGVQYRLEVAAGRRRGSNVFHTVVRPPPTE